MDESICSVPLGSDTHVSPGDVPVMEERNVLADDFVFRLLGVFGLVLRFRLVFGSGLVLSGHRLVGVDRGSRVPVGSGSGSGADRGDRESGNDGRGESHCGRFGVGSCFEGLCVCCS